MSDLTLTITQPTHGSAITTPVALAGTAVGNTTSMFFKWFSSLNAAATQTHPELNTANHGIASLNFAGPVLGEFGSHALVLAATDRDGIALADLQAVTRSVMVGGAPLEPPLPPNPPAPCVVHQLSGALFLNPATNGLTLSKANPTIDVLAPGAWAMPDAEHPGQWIVNTDYRQLNGVGLTLRFEPDGAPAGRARADVLLVPATASPPAPPFPWPSFFRQNDKTWLRVAGPLPATLGTGAYFLRLIASSGASSAPPVSRSVVLAP